MENLTFENWTLSQAHSFIIGMANAMVNSGQASFPVDFNDVMTEVYRTFEHHDYTDEGADSFTFGNYVITVNKKARKVGLLNTRNGKFVETYCNKKDNFAVFIGLGVVWAKYNHIERPKFISKKKLSELKPHDVFTISSGSRYEFIGTIKSIGLKNNYVAFSIDTGNTYRFADGAVTVVE